MLNVVYAVVGAVFMVGMTLFAFIKGGARERLGAGIYFLAWIASLVVQENVGFRGLPIGMFLIDAAVLVALAAIAWRAPQSWPTWATGLQLVTVMGHVMILTTKSVPIASLYTVMNLTSYLIILCIGVGTFWAWQERKLAAQYE
ncbi:hypothetical protein [uncultured Brevundimonas sp.]|uniref:hypothetical protein n=1 Tax=uncultured Brevundimonas sp. TaxID=213418 RepID=UPI002620506C|nr:hypothetical protein [uncultured Brevundimonas sp.]